MTSSSAMSPSTPKPFRQSKVYPFYSSSLYSTLLKPANPLFNNNPNAPTTLSTLQPVSKLGYTPIVTYRFLDDNNVGKRDSLAKVVVGKCSLFLSHNRTFQKAKLLVTANSVRPLSVSYTPTKTESVSMVVVDADGVVREPLFGIPLSNVSVLNVTTEPFPNSNVESLARAVTGNVEPVDHSVCEYIKTTCFIGVLQLSVADEQPLRLEYVACPDVLFNNLFVAPSARHV